MTGIFSLLARLSRIQSPGLRKWWSVRIFHLVPNMNFGGLQEIVRVLCLAQREAGHSVTIGCWTNVSDNAAAEAQLQDAGVQVVYLRRGPKGQLVAGKKYLFLKLKQYLSQGKADVLHVHNPFEHYLYGALTARAVGSTKVVQSIHATVWLDGRRKWKLIFWIGAMCTDAIVSVCEEVESVIRSRFILPGRKFHVIENGIDLERFLAVPPRSARNDIVIGTVGRMSPEKNQSVLLAAFAKLRARHSNIRLRILGVGILEAELTEQRTKLGLEDLVEFCGASNDVPAYLSTLDLFVLPSASEAMPLSLLEAIASGLPVVATAVGNVPRMVEITESGWICPPGDVDALTAALESAITCDELRQKGERARQKVSEYYSVERMSSDYEQLYLKLIHK
jgi:glycosyltransferase involved in cell wall biosynthesis